MMHKFKHVLCRCFCKNGRLWSCVVFCAGLLCTRGWNTVVAFFLARHSIIRLKDCELIIVVRQQCINYISSSSSS